MSENDEIRMTNDQLETLLGQFAPVDAVVDRDTLMYQAGYAAAASQLAPTRFGRHIWKTSTVLATAASVALALVLANQRPTDEAGQIATVEAPAQPSDPVVVATDAIVPVNREVRPATSDQPKPSPLLLADPSSNYLALRAAVLWRGVETWPTDYREPSHSAPVKGVQRSSTIQDLLNEILPTVQEPQEPAGDEPTEASSNNEETIV